MSNQELEINVSGRVQGVNFRGMCKRKALGLSLKGIIFNRVDGSVEIIIQGKRKELESFLNWIQNNPGFSKVDGLHYKWRKPSREFRNFQVLREESFILDQAKSFFNLGRFFLKKENSKVPIHVAIIPDGNRRWAKKKGLLAYEGHYTSASFRHLDEIFEEARGCGVKYLSFWAFSTENWKRDDVEKKALFDLLEKAIDKFKEDVNIVNIRFKHIGRKDRLPENLAESLEELEKMTAKKTGLNVQICLDYGGNDEIVRAVNKILELKIKNIGEEEFSSYLDSKDLPPVDLIIRTSGERRLSGFMPLQSAYAELYFSEVHFPDFDAGEFRKAIEDFSKRNRRFGGDKK